MEWYSPNPWMVYNIVAVIPRIIINRNFSVPKTVFVFKLMYFGARKTKQFSTLKFTTVSYRQEAGLFVFETHSDLIVSLIFPQQ